MHKGETDLNKLIKGMRPRLNPGRYVFCTVKDPSNLDLESVIGSFQETEGTTLISAQARADKLALQYDYVAAWITLEIHSALDAVGLTAAFSNALAKGGISCNVVAGYYHDHIFVDYEAKERAMDILNALVNGST